MSNLRHWLWLTTREGYPGKHTTELLQRFGTPEGVYFAQEEDYDDIEGLPSSLYQSLLDKNLEGADQLIHLCGSKDIQIITLQDAAYPQRLAQLPDAPLVLYVKGTLPVIDQEVAIAVVGAREASPYGIKSASRFGLDLARQGALILSGTAKGIDSAALTGALQAGGQVVAVLGNGVDVPYPSWNQDLYDDIAAHGALVSEYPPGTRPAGRNFPIRNRILSGLSLGVLVVEGTARSGSLITARHALDQGRDVFAVPGNIDAPLSEGPNGLIRRSEAKLVQDDWDVLTEYEFSYPHKIGPAHLLSQRETEERLTTVQRTAQQWPAGRGSKQEPVAPTPRSDLPFWADEDTPVLHRHQEEDGLTDDEAAVLQALQQGEKRTADELAETTGIPLRRVMSSLTLLQIRQGVKQDGGRYAAGAILRE